ncbi:MAG TPA: hypothetical protein VHV75_08985 [Solirubrobacteraceae bacterium]|jgi:hypothetical protein|nr:hypothetical protein [Solirubrobacteraceae bacterium]
MSIGSISDVLTRITAIEQQLQQLDNGSLLDSELGISSSDGSSDSSSSASSTGSTSSTDFADQLAQAQGTDTTSSTDSAVPTDSAVSTDSAVPTDTAVSTDSVVPTDSDASFGSLADSALASSAATTTATTAGVALPASTNTLLTSSQQQFASTLSADTGLNPSVVTSWLLAEESGNAAQSRQAAGNNDWLNVGDTDSGTYGSSDAVWSDPVSAATATAEWLHGQPSVAGYGTASSGIQAILSSVGQTPATQLQAIQDSGWSSGGYPSLDSLYQSVTGATLA